MTASWDEDTPQARKTRCDSCEKRIPATALRKRHGRWICRSCAGQTVLFPKSLLRKGAGGGSK